jgi:guanylate kinase
MGAIIGLSGKSGCGKDYVADAIIKDFPEFKFKNSSSRRHPSPSI